MSYSIENSRLTRAMVKAVDDQVAHLRRLAEETGQETRVTIGLFNDRAKVDVPIWEADVRRVVSIEPWYKPDGWTRLIDATLEIIGLVRAIPTTHGDHAFWLTVVTDGAENRSVARATTLTATLQQLGEAWTVSILVPDRYCRDQAVAWGFPPGNVQVWETTREGLVDVAATVQGATTAYYSARSAGARSVANLFTPDVSQLTQQTVNRTLRRLPPAEYQLIEWVSPQEQIADVVEHRTGRRYVLGSTFYRLARRSVVQAHKEVVLVHKKTGVAYHGPECRDLLKLPAHEVKVNPTSAPDYDIYVQSTSVNRSIKPGDKALVVLSRLAQPGVLAGVR